MLVVQRFLTLHVLVGHATDSKDRFRVQHIQLRDMSFRFLEESITFQFFSYCVLNCSHDIGREMGEGKNANYSWILVEKNSPDLLLIVGRIAGTCPIQKAEMS